MRNILAISFIILLSMPLTINSADATSTVKKIIGTTPGSSSYTNNIYNRDLIRIEKYLFGRIYSKESTVSRLNRIERHLFNRNYNSMNLAQRMNNILSNYREDDYNNRNYLADYYSNTTPAQRVFNRFVGQPTGFTPPITHTPFGSGSYRPGYSSSYYGNRGYGYQNSIPAITGAGIHILD